jgi:hypothetical protein
MQSRNTTNSTGEKAPLLALALVLGLSGGLFVNGYWLIDWFPGGSRQSLLATALTAIAATALYLPLLRATRRSLGALRPSQRGGAALLGVVLAGFLFFAGTRAWKATSRYVTFLLPRHEMHLFAESAPQGTALTWFKTSLGEVSFDEFLTHGWARRGDEMVLEDASRSSLTWIGQTGADAQLVFRTSRPDVDLRIVWDGQDELVTLGSRKSAYERSFPIPFYASRTLILLLGLSNLFVVALGLVALSIEHRAAWLPVLGRVSSGNGAPLDAICSSLWRALD